MTKTYKTVVLEELGKGQDKTLTVDIEVDHYIEKGDRLTPDYHEITLESARVSQFETETSDLKRDDHFAWDLLDDLAYELIEPDLLDYLD